MSNSTKGLIAFCMLGSALCAAQLMPRTVLTPLSRHPESAREVSLPQDSMPIQVFAMHASTDSYPDGQLTVGDSALQQACVASGLSASSLAAAGLSTAQTASCLAAAKTAIAENGATVQSAQNSLAALRAERDSLLRLAERGLLSETDGLRLAEVETGYSAAVTALQTACANLRTAAVANLPGSLQTAIQTVNDSPTTTPIAVRRVVSSDAASVSARNALANRRIAARAGQSFDPEAEPFALSTEQNDAVSDFQTRFPLVRDTWVNSTR